MELSLSNRVLPREVRDVIDEDSRTNWEDIVMAIEKVNQQVDIVDTKVIGRLVKMVISRYELKYKMEKDKKSVVAETLLSTYFMKRISYPMKLKVINLLERLFKDTKRDKLNLSVFFWKGLWNEALSICLRSHKTESTASEGLVSGLLKSVVSLLHIARHHINEDDAEDIVKTALVKLTDSRTQYCYEGLAMLVTCLPSDFKSYDQYLPDFVRIWSTVEHNPEWDSCWITILCRARKYAVSFPWEKMTGMLTVKLRWLFALPAVKGKSPRASGFPIYYSRLLSTAGTDYRNLCITKITKFLYLQAFQGPLVLCQPLTTTPPTLPPSAEAMQFPGLNAAATVHQGMANLALFLQTLRPYFYPSNAGVWSPHIACMINTLVAEMSRHVCKCLVNNLYVDVSLPKRTTGKVAEPVSKILEENVHLPTMQYLAGSLLPFLFEVKSCSIIILVTT